tara:strand:+ start:706 stop:1041 length:336 start_codon:yes stop_codon:yes gene_type:complete
MATPVLDEEAREKQLMEILMSLPDFERFPFPEYIFKKYNIKKPTIMPLMEALKQHNHIQNMPGDGKLEIRAPAEGGLRPLLEYDTKGMLEIKSGPIENEVVQHSESEGQSS